MLVIGLFSGVGCGAVGGWFSWFIVWFPFFFDFDSDDDF